MRQFLIQFRKEFTSYFNGLTAYALIAAYYILSFFSALYLGDYFLRESDVMNAYFVMQPLILILIIPAVTMRSWSDEIKSGTIELLLTQPIAYHTLVLAKYFAAFTFFVFLVWLSIPFLIISNFFSVLDWGIVFSSYCGLILCGGLFTAVGCLVSTFYRNNIISFICTICALFFISQLRFSAINDTVGSLPLDDFNFAKNFEAFLTGFLHWGNFAYFFITTALLLWLNTVVLAHKNNITKQESRLFKVFSLFIFLIFFTSILSSFLIFQKPFDLTQNHLYTLSSNSRDYLNTIKKRIDITLYEAKNKRDEGNSGYASFAGFVERLLGQIQQQSFNAVRYSVVRVEPFSALERRLINEQIPYEEDTFGNKVYMALDVSDSNGNNLRINSLNNLRQNLLEADIMRLIRLLGQDKKNIAVVAHSEDLTTMQGFRQFLGEFYEVTYLNFSLQYLPSTYDAVIVINPHNVTTEFLLALDQYLLNGGNIALFDEPSLISAKGDTYFTDFLYTYGFKPVPNKSVFVSEDTLGIAKTDENQWNDIRFILTNEAGEIGVRQSPMFTISQTLTFGNTPIAAFSSGKYVSHFPEFSLEYTDVLDQSVKEGRFFFIYDSDIIKDYLYITDDSKGTGFYQIISLADNPLFYAQLMDKLTESKTENGLTYRHYPMNTTSIGSFMLNSQKKRHAQKTLELQQKVEDLTKELKAIKHFSVQNMGYISNLTQDLEEAEDKLNQYKRLIIQKYQSDITLMTVLIILVIPAILLCFLFLFLRIYRKYKYTKIRRFFDDIQTS